jgi:hypothetical protein
MNRTDSRRSNSVRCLLYVLAAATAPPNKLEIHGEISFTYGFGKGSGYANGYRNPAWNSPMLRGVEP